MSPCPPVLRVVEPGNLRHIADVPTTSAAELAAMVRRSVNAQRDWSARPLAERASLLQAWQGRLAHHGEELIATLVRENGKPAHEARLHEFLPLLDALDWLAQSGPELLEERVLPSRWQKHRRHSVWRRPHGPTAIITPFNFPLLISGTESAAALLAGNPVLLKPSEHTPLTVMRAVELAHEAGIPTDVFGVVVGGAEVARSLVSSGVRAVVFVGSLAHGRSVAIACAERMIPCSLELGGNCPLLVFPAADLERAAHAIVFGALANSGQSCMGVGRTIVHESIRSELVSRLHALIEPLKQGDPTLGPVDLGALTTEAQLIRAEEQVSSAIERGAHLLLGGERGPRTGRFFKPTILDLCPPDSEVLLRETFAPVVAVTRFRERAEALALARTGECGLATYAFGVPETDTRALAASVDTAHLVFDDVLSTYVCPELPLAPRGKSGLAVTHGAAGLSWHTTPSVLSTSRFALPTSLQFKAPTSALLGNLVRLSSRLTRPFGNR